MATKPRRQQQQFLQVELLDKGEEALLVVGAIGEKTAKLEDAALDKELPPP